MKRKPKLLSTGNTIVKRLLDNLRENNLYYENRKITQCVFLGCLRLKPVPSVFTNRRYYSTCVPSAENRQKSSNHQRANHNLKKIVNIKSNNQTVTSVVAAKIAKKDAKIKRQIPSRKPIIKIDLTRENYEIKTEFKQEKFKLNPVRVVLTNIYRTRGEMDIMDLQSGPSKPNLQNTKIETNTKRMSLKSSDSKNKSIGSSFSNSPILLEDFEDESYCFRESLLKSDTETVIINDTDTIGVKSRRNSTTSTASSNDSNKEEIIEIFDKSKPRRTYMRSLRSTSANLTPIDVKPDVKTSPKARVKKTSEVLLRTSSRLKKDQDKVQILNHVVVVNAEDKQSSNCAIATPNIFDDVDLDNYYVSDLNDISSSYSGSPVDFKRCTRSLSSSPSKDERIVITRSKSASDITKDSKIEILGEKTVKNKRGKLNPLSVKVRVKKERQAAQPGIDIEEERLLYNYSPHRSPEKQDIADFEVEIASPKNSPMKLVKSQRQSSEDLSLDNDIEINQKSSVRQRVQRSFMSNEDTQIEIEQQKNLDNNGVIKKRRGRPPKIEKVGSGNKNNKKLKTNPVALKLKNIKKEKEDKSVKVEEEKIVESISVKKEPNENVDENLPKRGTRRSTLQEFKSLGKTKKNNQKEDEGKSEFVGKKRRSNNKENPVEKTDTNNETPAIKRKGRTTKQKVTKTEEEPAKQEDSPKKIVEGEDKVFIKPQKRKRRSAQSKDDPHDDERQNEEKKSTSTKKKRLEQTVLGYTIVHQEGELAEDVEPMINVNKATEKCKGNKTTENSTAEQTGLSNEEASRSLLRNNEIILTEILPIKTEVGPSNSKTPVRTGTYKQKSSTKTLSEVEVRPIFSPENSRGGAMDSDDESDCESRAEWVPEDYAEYKVKFERQKLKKRAIFKCKVCLMLFPSYYKLNKHANMHSLKQDPYECSMCDEHFTNVIDLNAHIRMHKGQPPYTCTKCDKPFWSKPEYEKHKEVHVLAKLKPRVKRFRCDTCLKEFAKLCDVERHLRVHTGEKPCVCDICHKRFQQPYNLSKHLLTHLQVKPFRCEICSQRFGRADVLNRHLLVHSVQKPFVCLECGRGFIRGLQLMQHVKNKHKNKLEIYQRMYPNVK